MAETKPAAGSQSPSESEAKAPAKAKASSEPKGSAPSDYKDLPEGVNGGAATIDNPPKEATTAFTSAEEQFKK